MDYFVDNKRKDTTIKKKYDLSLKSRGHNNADKNAHSRNIDGPTNRRLMDEKTELARFESVDSQNFTLRLSDSFIVNDTIDKPEDNNVNRKNQVSEVIIISDSSDDEYANIFAKNKKNESPSRLQKIVNSKRNSSPISVSSIDISEIWTDEEKKNQNSPIKNKITHSELKAIRQSSLLTSDESGIANTGDSRPKQVQGTSEKSKTLQDVNKKSNRIPGTPNSAKLSTRTTPLTKKDTRDIMRAIKSKRAVYDSPGQWQRNKVIVNSDSDSSEDVSDGRDVNNRGKNKAKHPVWIDETESESGDRQAQDNHADLPKPYKTHVSRFLDPTIQGDTCVTLSERKKQDISQWIMTNPLDIGSDTSLSYIAPSQKNSLSSGNSSLERLEENYETPNNRDKFHSKTYITQKPKKCPTPTRLVQSAKLRQTTMDSFLKKFKRGNPKYYTPIPISTNRRKVVTPPSDERAKFQIDDCADILDKLYGNAWRDKADALLPNSELRKKNIELRNRGVQTERKVCGKSKKNSAGSSDVSSHNDEGFHTFVKNIKPNLNSTKKSVVKGKKVHDSFINDESSYEASDGGETTFQTALTTPRISSQQIRLKKTTPMSIMIQKAIEICDSDTEDDDRNIPFEKNVDNRRRLSFSDDEASTTGTSEYDPDDIILPKSVVKIGTTVLSKGTAAKPQNFMKTATTKSFLASLSASVPMENAHPDAKKYRLYYKTTKDELCKHLYNLYNEKIFEKKLPHDMSTEWNVRMRGTAGFCYNKTTKKALGGVERSSRIVLATKILDAPDRLRDTLVHEMCHAATWLINEVSDGHGPFWQTWASKAMKAFPELPPIKRCHDYKISTKYTYRCVDCGYSVGRHSKSLDVEKKRCGHCFGKFELLINKTTKAGIVQVKTPSNKQPSGFALFVKENYQSVKKERQAAGHKEVMQILGFRMGDDAH